jgi:hypothetical protein
MYDIYVRLTTNEVLHAFTWTGNPDSGILRAAGEAIEHGLSVEDIWAEERK